MAYVAKLRFKKPDMRIASCMLLAVNLYGAPAALTTFSSIIILPNSFAPAFKQS